MAKSAARIEAERLVGEFVGVPSRTLARRLATEYKITIESARSAIRLARGTHGNEKRKKASTPTPKAMAGHIPKMPPSLAEGWTPFEFNVKHCGIISDTHIPYHSEQALQAAVKHLKKSKIDGLLINGDFADFYTISRWEKNPKKRNLGAEMKAVRAALEWIRHEFPDIPIVYKMGNHDERWDHWLWNHAPEISDEPEMRLSEWLHFKRLDIEHVGDQRPVMLGNLPVFHGHELGRSIFSPVNPARGAFLRTHHTVLVAHSHQTSGHADTDLWHNETFVWSQGCLCDMNPEYARVNRWNHGFAEVEIDSDKSFDVQNFRINSSGNVRKS